MSTFNVNHLNQNIFSSMFSDNNRIKDYSLFHLFKLLLDKQSIPVFVVYLIHFYELLVNLYFIGLINKIELFTNNSFFKVVIFLHGQETVANSNNLIGSGVVTVILITIIILCFRIGNNLYSSGFYMKKNKYYDSLLYSILMNMIVLVFLLIQNALLCYALNNCFKILKASSNYSSINIILCFLLFCINLSCLLFVALLKILFLNKNNYLRQSWKTLSWSNINQTFKVWLVVKRFVFVLIVTFDITAHFNLINLFMYYVTLKDRLLNIGYASISVKIVQVVFEVFEFLFYLFSYLVYLKFTTFTWYSFDLVLLGGLCISYTIIAYNKKFLLKISNKYYYYFWYESINKSATDSYHKAFILGLFSDHRKSCVSKVCICEKLFGVFHSLNNNHNTVPKRSTLGTNLEYDEMTDTILSNNNLETNKNKEEKEQVNIMKEDSIISPQNSKGNKIKYLWIELWTQAYSQYLEKIKKNKLDLISIQILLFVINAIAYDLKNPYQAIIECKTMLQMVNGKIHRENSYIEYLVIKFNIFLLEENIKELIIQNQVNDLTYYNLYNSLIKYNTKYELFLCNIQSTTNQVLAFLSFIYDKKKMQMKADQSVIDKLRNMYSVINTQTNTLIESFHELSETGNEDYKILFLYSKLFDYIYLIPNFKIDFEEKFEFCLRLYLSQSILPSSSINTIKKIKYFDNPIGCSICIISGNIKELGIIKYVNYNFQKISDYTARELVYNNISIIMPDNIGRYHNYFLKNFYQSETSSVLDHIRSVPVKKKDKFLLLTDLLVKIFPSFSQGLCFIGYLIEDQSINYNKDQGVKNGFMLISNDVHIEGISKEVTLSTNFIPEVIPRTILNKTNSELNAIFTLIPNYHNIITELSPDSQFEQVSITPFNENSALNLNKVNIQKSMTVTRELEISKSKSNLYNKENSTLSFLFDGDNIANSNSILVGIATELEAMNNDLDNSDIISYKENCGGPHNRDELKVKKIKSYLNKWKDLVYSNNFDLTFSIKIKPFAISKMELNFTFLQLKIILIKKHNKNLLKKILKKVQIQNNLDQLDTEELNKQDLKENTAISGISMINDPQNYTDENNNSSMLESMPNEMYNNSVVDERDINTASDESLQHEDNLDFIKIESNDDIKKHDIINSRTNYSSSNNNFKVKTIKSESIKNLTQLFTKTDSSVSLSNTFSLINHYLLVFLIFVILFNIIMYFVFNNTINENISFIYKKLIYMNTGLRLNTKTNNFLILLLLNTHKFNNQNNTLDSILSPELNFTSFNELESLLIDNLNTSTKNLTSNTLRLLEISKDKNETDFLYNIEINNTIFNMDYEATYTQTSLINNLNLYDYVIRSIFNLDITDKVDSFTYDLSDFSQEKSLKIINFLLNSNSNTVSYIIDKLEAMINSNQIALDEHKFNIYMYLVALIAVSLLGSIFLSYKIDSILITNKKIFTFLLNLNHSLIKKRIRQLQNFNSVLTNCSNINNLNMLIKTDFFILMEIKKITRKKVELKPSKSQLESTSGSVESVSSVGSSISNYNSENAKKNNIFTNKLHEEIKKMLLIHPDFNLFDPETNNNNSFANSVSPLAMETQPTASLVPQSKENENFIPKDKDLFTLDKKGVSVIINKNDLKFIFLFSLVIFFVFISFFLALIFLKISNHKVTGDLNTQVDSISFKGLTNDALVNSVMLKWYSSYISKDSSKITKISQVVKNVDKFSEDLIKFEYNDLRNKLMIENLSLFEILNKIELIEPSFTQQYSILSTYISLGEIFVDVKQNTFCQFYINFINLSIDRLVNDKLASFLTYNNTLDILNNILKLN